MKYSRWLILLMLLVIVAGLLAAQDTASTYCGQLSEDDCAILQASTVAMRDVNATAFELQMDLTVNNIPDAPFESLILTLNGDGSVAVDTSAFTEFEAQPTAVDIMSFYPLISDWLRTVKTDMTLTLNLPQELIDAVADEGTTLPDSLTLNLRMLDGILYVDLTEVASLDLQGNIPTGWVGLDVAELYGSVLPQMAGDTAINFDMTPMMTAFMEPDNLAQFITIERLDDVEVMGQTMAVFEMELDYVAMLDVPAFRDMLTSTIPEGQEADAEEMMAVIRAMYSGMTVIITEQIGLEDGLIHNIAFHLVWDGTSFAEMMGETTAPVIELNLAITLDEFNTDFEVTVPENVTMLPLEQLIPTPESGE